MVALAVLSIKLILEGKMNGRWRARRASAELSIFFSRWQPPHTRLMLDVVLAGELASLWNEEPLSSSSFLQRIMRCLSLKQIVGWKPPFKN
jgi:hypothetical protein